jgi:signal transduction histidine kinase
MISIASSNRLQYVLVIAWLVTTVSLASWWLSLGLSLDDRLERMFLWEGMAFIALLVAGGIALVLAIRRESGRRRALETFFLSFTHDLKTSLARVQLHADGLREDWPDAGREAVDRLLADTMRLQIQLENSLFVAQPDGRLLSETIEVADVVRRLASDWPDLDVAIVGRAKVTGDARAFEAVIRNLLQNAVVHGAARHVTITLDHASEATVRISVADDGRGVSPESLPSLGEPFVTSSQARGTGMGLFVSAQLLSRMKGRMRFGHADRGLLVTLELPGAI